MLRALTPERLAGRPRDLLSTGLESALDPGAQRPRLRDDAELAAFTTRWGERYAIAHSRKTGAYLRLTGDEGDLAAQLDGVRSVGELVVDAVGGSDGLDPGRLVDLVSVLRSQGCLEQPALDAYGAVRTRMQPRSRRALLAVWRWLRRQTIAVPGADAFTRSVYGAVGRLAFTAPANVLAVAAMVAGLSAFVALARRGGYALVGPVSTGTAVSLFAFGLLALFVHEMGHALAVRHAGRRVIRAGFQLYLGHPAFFIDSSDLLLASRRARAINALAGPYAEAVAAGAVAIAAWLWPDRAATPLLFRFAGITYLNVLINLIPFIELDGYWLLSDLLDVPRLRPRAFAVLRYELPDRIRRRRLALTPVERGLAAFGVAGVAFSAAALVTAWTFWGPIARRLLDVLWRSGAGGRAALVLLACLTLGPLVHAAGHAARAFARRLRIAAADVRFRAQTSWRIGAAHAIAALPFVGELDDEALADIAGRVTRRRAGEGAVIVRQDDAAHEFFVVRRGRFTVTELDAEGRERVLRRAGPGDSFGELALLQRRPRTATVRAETDGELFVVDAGTFQRLLAPRMSAPDLEPAVGPVLDVWTLPAFRHLKQADAALLAERGEWLSVGPSQDVVGQGDPPDGFYVLASGQAEVIRGGQRTAVLRAGDHFGETALLRDVARTATVRTLTACRLFRIDAAAFRTLVAGAFARGALREAGAYEASGAH